MNSSIVSLRYALHTHYTALCVGWCASVGQCMRYPHTVPTLYQCMLVLCGYYMWVHIYRTCIMCIYTRTFKGVHIHSKIHLGLFSIVFIALSFGKNILLFAECVSFFIYVNYMVSYHTYTSQYMIDNVYCVCVCLCAL